MSEIDEIVAQVRAAHRRRRFAMKTQQKLDRSLESWVRVNLTDWHPDLPEAERTKINKQIAGQIKAARTEQSDLGTLVRANDKGREPYDTIREDNEKLMTRLAKSLPVYLHVEEVKGAGALGLATILAETGNLSNYATVSRVWKRLGFAPYEGLAGSTWKREKWRPRALTSEEWIENPFAGERYALMRAIADSMFRHQWSKAEDENATGKPTGPYGEEYAKRRAHTAETHPDWTPGHSHADALRIMMKKFLMELTVRWHAIHGKVENDRAKPLMQSTDHVPDQRPADESMKSRSILPAASIPENEQASAEVKTDPRLPARKRLAKPPTKTADVLPAAPLSDQASAGLKPQ